MHFLCKIRGFSVSAKAKTSCFTMLQALFFSKNAAKSKEIAFFASGNGAVARVLGVSLEPKSAQKASF